MALNKVIITGNLTRDPEIRYSQGENANASVRFSLGVQRGFKNSEGNYDSDFPNFVAFGKTAEFIEKYFHKGDKMEVVGSLRTGSYTNKDGIKVYTTDVNVESVGFGGGKNSATNDGTTTTNQPIDDAPDVDGELPF